MEPIASDRLEEREDEELKEKNVDSINDSEYQPDSNMSDFKILVAEDNATHKVLLNYILKNELKITNVVFAKDGQEACQILKETFKKEVHFDCCIIDYSMPFINGINVIKWY